MLVDPLSQVLSLLRPEGYLTAGLDAGGRWGVRFDNQAGVIKCHAILKGDCWLALDGETPVKVEAGDCIVLLSGKSFTLASDLEQSPVPARVLLKDAQPGDTVRINDGGAFRLIGTRFLVDAGNVERLLGTMPALVHLRAAADAGVLRWSIEQIMAETAEASPGTSLARHHLAHLILLQALRLHLSGMTDVRIGMLYALSDKRLARAIEAMHREPGRAWTLARLAAQAGLSRSAFADRFRDRVAETPIAYLTRWRMMLAAERLRTGAEKLAGIAHSLGYGSENAFSTAFKRVIGCPPTRFSPEHVLPPAVGSTPAQRSSGRTAERQ
jgi:AraC-like DNA-binding protein